MDVNGSIDIKEKVSLIYVGECLLEGTLVLNHRLCEVGLPFLSLATLSPQCFHQVAIHCWIDRKQRFNPLLEVRLQPWIFGIVGKHPNHAHLLKLMFVTSIVKLVCRTEYLRFQFFDFCEIYDVFDICYVCDVKVIKLLPSLLWK